MASGGAKSAAFVLLLLNLLLYFVVSVIAVWAVNHAIMRSRETASVLEVPARIFPIYFPFGNMATGYLVIFSLIAGIVGMTTSATGIQNITRGGIANLHAAAASSLITLFLTFLAMGLACKEIDIGWTDANLRTLEVMVIFVSATQLFCTGAVHAGVSDVTNTQSAYRGGRV
ncbi:membrane protein PM19L-like [Rhodamnia argentea]|uniref:Membrane protein PM19L n=1 Tax=Rhodamnia argentea TaxID=178133 RepID=A0A8B8MXT0_9MYRT|nr:membrane protein PM19L [Rhodamnia argentea]XP_048129749.1 membrane protein PM19L-like [Rhodamnia argentea]